MTLDSKDHCDLLADDVRFTKIEDSRCAATGNAQGNIVEVKIVRPRLEALRALDVNELGAIKSPDGVAKFRDIYPLKKGKPLQQFLCRSTGDIQKTL